MAHHHGLNAAWHTLGWLGPAEYNRFRDQLGAGSGLHSLAYRHLSFLLGDKSRALVPAHRVDPEGHRLLLDALAAPSLYDDVLGLVHRCGYPLPDNVLGRDPAAGYEPSPDVEAAWAAIYRDEPPGSRLAELAESLTDLAEAASTWRYRHLTAVRRAIGGRPGTAGSAGLTWLEKRVGRMYFPELWSARTEVQP